MITVKILTDEGEGLKRTLAGCLHYRIKTRYSRQTAPYVIATLKEEEAINLFWLGANLSSTPINTPLTKSPF